MFEIVEHTHHLLPLYVGKGRLGKRQMGSMEKCLDSGKHVGGERQQPVVGIVGHEAVDMIALLAQFFTGERGQSLCVVEVIAPVIKFIDFNGTECA